MKRYYADYVGHCLKFYAHHQDATVFRSRVDEANWKAVDRALNKIPAEEAEYILGIYGGNTDVGEGVYITAEANEVSEKYLWSVVKRTELLIAKERGLV